MATLPEYSPWQIRAIQAIILHFNKTISRVGIGGGDVQHEHIRLKAALINVYFIYCFRKEKPKPETEILKTDKAKSSDDSPIREGPMRTDLIDKNIDIVNVQPSSSKYDDVITDEDLNMDLEKKGKS